MSTAYLHQLPAIRAKFDKIAERATKRGFAGGLTLHVGEPYDRKEGGPYPLPTYTRTVVDLEVSGTAPKYDGWTIIARIDVLASGAAVAVNAPGVDEAIALDDYTPGSCDHCHSNRRRNQTYIVQHDNGDRRFVGSTCLKDFLGWTTTPYLVFRNHIDIDALVDGTAHDPYYPLVEVVTFAELSIRDRGYVRASDTYDGGPEPTKSDVHGVLIARSAADRRRRQELVRILDQSAEDVQGSVAKIIAYIRSDEFGGDSSYITTLKTLFAEDSIEPKHLGYAVSAAQAYRRHLETTAERAAREARHQAEADRRANAQPVPTGKHTVEGVVISTRIQENHFSRNGGITLKMVVLDNRGFKIWSTLPATITPAGAVEDLVGSRVRYTATLKPSPDDNTFGSAKRPTKATVLDDGRNLKE